MWCTVYKSFSSWNIENKVKWKLVACIHNPPDFPAYIGYFIYITKHCIVLQCTSGTRGRTRVDKWPPSHCRVRSLCPSRTNARWGGDLSLCLLTSSIFFPRSSLYLLGCWTSILGRCCGYLNPVMSCTVLYCMYYAAGGVLAGPGGLAPRPGHLCVRPLHRGSVLHQPRLRVSRDVLSRYPRYPR